MHQPPPHYTYQPQTTQTALPIKSSRIESLQLNLRRQHSTRSHQSLLQTPSQSTAMSTPESAAFLAKKPTVKPTFEGVDYDDNKALRDAQDAIIREQWVKLMMSRLVQEELSKCYRKNGNNHLEKCGLLRERYLELMPYTKIRGFKFEQTVLPPKKPE